MAAELSMDAAAVTRVLLLEDSDIDAELVASHLQKAGLRCVVRRAIDRQSFIAALREEAFDVVLADYSLPDFDGLTALDLVRELTPDLPFIFVSGVVGEEFAINALRRGATDYVMKRGLNRLPAAIDRALAEAHERAERVRAQEALRLSELSNQLAVEIAGLGKWTLDADTLQLELDARSRALLGFAAHEQVSFDRFIASCDPRDSARVRSAVLQAARGGGSERLTIEYRIKRQSDGQDRWLSISAQSFYDEARFIRLIGVAADITERKRVETSLQEINQTLTLRVAQRTAERDQLWQLSQDLMAVIDPEGCFVEVNPAWTEVLGYGEEELIGTQYFDYVHSKDAEHTRLPRAADGSRVALRPFEIRLRHKDGHYRVIALSAAPGDAGTYVVGRDVTEDREAAMRLAQTQEALRQSQKMEAVGQLTGGVAHDFNNLLQVVVGNLETLQRKLPVQEGRLRRAADHAMEGARRAANLTQRLLAFSRRQPLNPRAVEINRLVKGMTELVKRTLGERIDVQTELATDLWRVGIDENQLENALLNLAVNARDAMPDGGCLHIQTSNQSFEHGEPDGLTAGDYVALTVGDNGSGMSPEVLAHAFEPFFTTKAVGQGTGLGLSQVYGFVKQSGGHVRIESIPGSGTTVQILLPRLMHSAGDSDESSETPVADAGAARETVLVVEDDAGVRTYTVEVLRELGYTVHAASDGQEALKILGDRAVGKVDLLFSDVVLPGGVNGQQLAQRAVSLRPGLKVLFATGYARDVIVHDGRLDPGVQVIAKPFAYEELAAKLRFVLDAPSA